MTSDNTRIPETDTPRGSCEQSVRHIPGWVYYLIFNAMQYSGTVLETTALVMHDSNTFDTIFSYGYANFTNINNIS